MKNEEYYKQLIGVLLAVLNIVAFFIIAVSTAGYTLIKKNNDFYSYIFFVVLCIIEVSLFVMVIIIVLKLFSLAKKLKR